MENTTAGEAPVIQFAAKALAPVALFMAQTDVRYYLNGICVMPNKGGSGCFVVGCDGHRLAVWHDPDGVCTKLTVLKVGKELISASRKKVGKDGKICFEDGRIVLRDRHEQEVFIQAGKAEIECSETPSCGGYPDIWRVVPKASNLHPGLHGAINGRYIEAIGKVSRMLEEGGAWGHACGVWHFSSKTGANWGAVLTRFSKAPGFIVITMPMREDGFETASLTSAFSGQGVVEVTAPATVLHPMGSMGESV